ncbi:uncharacterized protein B0H18DRAFT_332377 [Fomitopsis serialis]|uniref:uncharacterized protein n=1 Tax=Fomitopsis serialis TaxID=139415 RepID=UPI002007EFBD|nr:uncharacterized protein B0H18DRAFT_332377 [Neoantrodia serialis]KAH9926761.1 hypothetical protein B0H18DRAFT_332377 [Neoantrodia serialis]
MTFVTTIRIVATVCECTAIVTTTLRLYYRASRRHIGLDDAWAAFSLIAVIFLLAGAWIRSDASLPLHRRVLGYFMLNSCFTCVLWSARMSILFSIMRIIPRLMHMRRHTYFCAALFLIMWIVVLTQKLYICVHNDEWQHKPNAQCILGESVGGVELASEPIHRSIGRGMCSHSTTIADIIADTILVALPIRLLWDIGISSSTRKLLMAIFSASMVTTVVSIVHTAFELGPNRNAEAIAAHVEATVSLIICNLAVLVTWLVRLLRYGEDLDRAGGPTRRRGRRATPRRGPRSASGTPRSCSPPARWAVRAAAMRRTMMLRAARSCRRLSSTSAPRTASLPCPRRAGGL